MTRLEMLDALRWRIAIRIALERSALRVALERSSTAPRHPQKAA
jgi:hypothetical protein